MLRVNAENQNDRFESEFARRCATGCEADLSDAPDLAKLRDDAQFKRNVAVGLMVGGGVAAIGGLIWAAINRPRAVTIDVSPVAGGATTAVRWTF